MILPILLLIVSLEIVVNPVQAQSTGSILLLGSGSSLVEEGMNY